MKLQISEGNPYQYIDGLFEVANEQSANLLQLSAQRNRPYCALFRPFLCLVYYYFVSLPAET